VGLSEHADPALGDIKPRNIVRFGEAIKIIDLDASVRFGTGAKLGVKFSSGYVSPEMLSVDVSGTVQVATVSVDDEGNLEQYETSGERMLVPAIPATSVDMWSLGVVLYQLLAGELILLRRASFQTATNALKELIN
jgi:serine/threonine protein kinase